MTNETVELARRFCMKWCTDGSEDVFLRELSQIIETAVKEATDQMLATPRGWK